MREKLLTLPIQELKNIAKENHVPNYYRLKKAELVDALLLLDEAIKPESKKAETKKPAIEAPKKRGRKPRKEKESEEPSAASDKEQEHSPNAMTTKSARPGRKPTRKPSSKHAEKESSSETVLNSTESEVSVSAPEEASASKADLPSSPAPEYREKSYTPNKRSYQNRSYQNRSYQNRNANNKGYWYPPNTDGSNFESQSRSPERSQEPEKTTEQPDLNAPAAENAFPKSFQEFDTGLKTEGILEVMPDGFGFMRSNGLFSGNDDIYVAPSQIRRFNLKTGDYLVGTKRQKLPQEKYSAILYIDTINGLTCDEHFKIVPFESMTPVFPHERLHLEYPGCDTSLRIVDLISPIGKGQRGMIVAQPKVGKTTILKQITRALVRNHPDLYVMILLIDERPEEVTDMQDTFRDTSVEIEYSTFDELPEHHKKVTEMVMERAKRLAECGQDVVILTDSITRMARAYNLTVAPSGRTLSGGLDPAALYTPKKFFGSARALKEGGSLTILATALQETGSRMDDMVYEEFKGTGNMELVLSRKLSERRIFPAIDILKSSTRRDDLLLTPDEQETLKKIHAVTAGERDQEIATERILDTFAATRSNAEFIAKFKYVMF